MTQKAVNCSLLILICFLLAANTWAAQKRVALVIGNSSYQSSPLSNPVNDAHDMADTLRSLGFDVDVHIDLDRKKMREAIRFFGERLKKSDVGLFYFAGHGVQIEGKNYLVPISADVHSADEVQDESIDAGSVLRKMETAGNAVNIVILDACRNNPFARSFRNLEQGLARMDGPVGSFIAYATAPGSVAADGEGRNGLYTQHLLTALKQPGLTIEQTFKKVRNGVIQDTAGRQIPWESSSLTGEFVFSHDNSRADKRLTIPPPVLVKGYLQIIGNVPHAKVRINQSPKGQLDDSGVLNLSNLRASETEVVVEAPGYFKEKKIVELVPGQWRQLNIVLKPASKPDTIHDQKQKTVSISRSKQCLPGKRAILFARSEFTPLAKKTRVKINAPKFSGLLYGIFKKYDLSFIDVDTVVTRRMYQRMAKEGSSFYQNMAKRFNVDYLVKASIVAWETPIKTVATSMRTIHGDLNLSLIDLNSGIILGEASDSFLKAGLDMATVVNTNVRSKVNHVIEKLLDQACAG